MRSQGHSMRVIAAALTVNRRTLSRWSKQGPQSPALTRTRNHHKRKLSTNIAASLVQHICANNTSTLRRAAVWVLETYGIFVSIQTVLRCCKRAKLTYKKGSKAYTEMCQVRAQHWLQQIAATFGHRTIALDEAAFFYNHVTGYAWSFKGTKALSNGSSTREP